MELKCKSCLTFILLMHMLIASAQTHYLLRFGGFDFAGMDL
jgi:hypothetical protein